MAWPNSDWQEFGEIVPQPIAAVKIVGSQIPRDRLVMSSRFPDIQTHWARPFITALADRAILQGYQDGTFRPERAMTRAEFAAVIQSCLPIRAKRPAIAFTDVPANHWAAAAIRRVYEAGYLSGYPRQEFRPNGSITRLEALIALASGLELQAQRPISLPQLFEDHKDIPTWAIAALTAATDAELVVNYPNLQRLRPHQPAVRAEVAAFLYQALVRLGQMPAIESSAIVRWVQTVFVSHTRELRAAWVAAVWYSDFPSKAGLTAQQQQAELVKILDQLQDLNFNALILQVRPEGDALYTSAIEPWSHWLTGQQGKNPGYDPLEFAIAQCHMRGIELHAWFNPYRAATSKSTVLATNHIAKANASVVYEWGSQLWMDPGHTVVQEQTYRVILDVVRRYDIDAVHLDDYFYPYPIAGQTFPDSKTYAAYQAKGGQLALADWRRDNVNRMVQRLANGIRAIKPHVKFGISPFGIYRPGQPPGIQGLDAYATLYADALKWWQQGWVDYLAPQLYWRTDATAQAYATLLDWWLANNPKQRHLYAGNRLTENNNQNRDLAEIEQQVTLTRQRSAQLALGNIFFKMEDLLINRQGVRDRFQTVTYRTPALPPVQPWLSYPTLPRPSGVSTQNRTLTWKLQPNVRSWAIYRQVGEQWTLHQILPPGVSSLPVDAGTYGVAAVDRLWRETAAVVVRA